MTAATPPAADVAPWSDVLAARVECRAARWPEHHRDDCAWCRFVGGRLSVECPACGGAGLRSRCVNDGSHGCSHTNDPEWPCSVCREYGAVTYAELVDAAEYAIGEADEHDAEPEPWATEFRP